MMRETNGACSAVLAACGAAMGLSAAAAAGQASELFPVSMKGAITIAPAAVQPIVGVRTDGRLVLGERVELAGVSSPIGRGPFAPTTVYDSYGIGNDTDGDGVGDPVCGDLCGGLSLPSSRFSFGPTFGWQAFVDDVKLNASTVIRSPSLTGFRLPLTFLSCDSSSTLEPLVIIFTAYETPDVAGYDTDGDGQDDSPYPRTDTDSDGLIDQFTGGAIVTFVNTDTDGDGTFDVLLPGRYDLAATNLTDTDGDGLPGNIDLGGFPETDFDGDGRLDGAIEVFLTQGEGPDTDGDGDGNGPIYGAFVASTVASPFVWGTRDADTTGCAAANGVVASGTSPVFWGQGFNGCPPGAINEGSGFSDGASDGGIVNNFWDPTIDSSDTAGAMACPDPLAPAILVEGREILSCIISGCADVNGDCFITPADFNAWVAAYNAGGLRCDQNGDRECTPADFNAWVLNFNSGAPCP
ncbi:MAG: hypothetical protein AAGJ54_12860 [Planctomycetota bacterium]